MSLKWLREGHLASGSVVGKLTSKNSWFGESSTVLLPPLTPSWLSVSSLSPPDARMSPFHLAKKRLILGVGTCQTPGWMSWKMKLCGHSVILELKGTTDDLYPNLTSQGVQIVTHLVTCPREPGLTSVEPTPRSLAGICQIFALTKGWCLKHQHSYLFVL